MRKPIGSPRSAALYRDAHCSGENERGCLSRAFELSGFVARNLSGCHIALGGRYEADTSATGDTEDAI